MFFMYEWALMEELTADYKRQAEASGSEPGGNDSSAQTGALGSEEEGFFARVHSGEIADGSWEPYFPSASKNDRAATAVELQAIFGVAYVDERN